MPKDVKEGYLFWRFIFKNNQFKCTLLLYSYFLSLFDMILCFKLVSEKVNPLTPVTGYSADRFLRPCVCRGLCPCQSVRHRAGCAGGQPDQ